MESGSRCYPDGMVGSTMTGILGSLQQGHATVGQALGTATPEGVPEAPLPPCIPGVARTHHVDKAGDPLPGHEQRADGWNVPAWRNVLQLHTMLRHCSSCLGAASSWHSLSTPLDWAPPEVSGADLAVSSQEEAGTSPEHWVTRSQFPHPRAMDPRLPSCRLQCQESTPLSVSVSRATS